MTSVYIISLSSSRDCSYTEQTSHTSEASQSCQPPAVKHQLTASSQKEFDSNGSFLDKDAHSDRVAQVDIYEAHRNKSPFQGHDKTCSHRLEDVDVSFCDNTFADIEETISSMSPRNHPIARFPSISVQDVGLVFAGFVLHLFPQGLGNSYGVVYTHLKEMEGYSDYQMSWIGSLMAGMLGVGGMIVRHVAGFQFMLLCCVVNVLEPDTHSQINSILHYLPRFLCKSHPYIICTNKTIHRIAKSRYHNANLCLSLAHLSALDSIMPDIKYSTQIMTVFLW